MSFCPHKTVFTSMYVCVCVCVCRVWQLCSPASWRRGTTGTQRDVNDWQPWEHQRGCSSNETPPAYQHQCHWTTTSRWPTNDLAHWPDPVRPNQTWTCRRTETLRCRHHPGTSLWRHTQSDMAVVSVVCVEINVNFYMKFVENLQTQS